MPMTDPIIENIDRNDTVNKEDKKKNKNEQTEDTYKCCLFCDLQTCCDEC